VLTFWSFAGAARWNILQPQLLEKQGVHMSQKNRPCAVPLAIIVLLICTLSLTVLAADGEFSGKWKGEAKAAAPAARGGAAPAAGPAGAQGTPDGATSGAAAPAPTGGGGGRGGGFGGGRGGGFGAPGGGAGGFGGGSQKVSLNLKQSKDNKLSGNIVFGDSDAYDVKEGHVEGNTITFKAGRAPQPIYEYKGELKENSLTLTRTAPDGRGRPQDYVLTKK
jgi:hypothetical protein